MKTHSITVENVDKLFAKTAEECVYKLHKLTKLVMYSKTLTVYLLTYLLERVAVVRQEVTSSGCASVYRP